MKRSEKPELNKRKGKIMNFLSGDQAKLMSRLTKREQLEAELMRDNKTIECEYKGHILTLMHDHHVQGSDDEECRFYTIILPDGTKYPVQGYFRERMSNAAFKALVYALNYDIGNSAYNPQVVNG